MEIKLILNYLGYFNRCNLKRISLYYLFYDFLINRTFFLNFSVSFLYIKLISLLTLNYLQIFLWYFSFSKYWKIIRIIKMFLKIRVFRLIIRIFQNWRKDRRKGEQELFKKYLGHISLLFLCEIPTKKFNDTFSRYKD